MRNFKCTVAYDGTRYCGYQRQRGQNTIQSELEQAAGKIFGEKTTIYASGRTDSGVHALEQVIHFRTESRIPVQRIAPALNSVLPPDIVIMRAELTDDHFHARKSAIGKTYVYHIFNKPLPCPFQRHYSLHIATPLDLVAMQKAASLLVGRHDYSAFQAAGSTVQNTVRTITDSKLEKEKDMILFTVSADGFLYNMVRIMVGTLLEIGKGKMGPEHMAYLLRSGVRPEAGPTAPPHGLFLKTVKYPTPQPLT